LHRFFKPVIICTIPWTYSQQYIQIEAKENYTASNANLGFRFFMQVLEK